MGVEVNLPRIVASSTSNPALPLCQGPLSGRRAVVYGEGDLLVQSLLEVLGLHGGHAEVVLLLTVGEVMGFGRGTKISTSK